ncbi:hypothetical protein N7471_011771 [Penicillium samsonianum]|uniref:uncharacterized protein n=1 Tax=Penicillium samsonianum TaxID=1882272 RepID=UPI002547FC39|nr:uncharacterized protein N7471_011771 [Penicillium samsonianum]KAJ6124454.1 hypothetical protein N7471_011771 [Penicillium samsonianum]
MSHVKGMVGNKDAARRLEKKARNEDSQFVASTGSIASGRQVETAGVRDRDWVTLTGRMRESL